VVDHPPPCTIPPTCRWHAAEGISACHRCPQVVTMIPKADDALNRAARPDSTCLSSAAPMASLDYSQTAVPERS
jgi:hypothetical protein